MNEHFVAYFLVALAGALAWPASKRKLQIGALLTATACAAEVIQIYVPGRNAELGGAVSAAAGAWAALLLAWFLHRLLPPRAEGDI